MQTYNVLLPNEFGTSMVQIPSVSTIELEPNKDDVLVLFVYNPGNRFFAISHFPFESMTATPSKVSVDVDRTPYSPLCMRLA